MAREIKVPLKLETTQAVRAAKQLKTELAGAGDEAEQAGNKGTQSFDLFGSSVGAAFTAVGAGIGVAAGAIAVLDQINARLERINESRREALNLDRQRQLAGAQRLADPGIRALADIRNAPEAETLRDVIEVAARFDVPEETARAAAFGIESSNISAILGPQGARDVTADALRVARITGASGGTVAGLALTGQESGLGTRDEIAQFMAQAVVAARTSRVSLQELGSVLTETLPLATAAGIPIDRFMAVAAQMSFRIGSPEKIRTALRQMIRAAQIQSPALDKLAQTAGVSLADASTLDIVQLQTEFILGARGQQQIGARVRELGLPAELSEILLTTQDAASRESAIARARTVSGADFAGDVLGRFQERVGTPAAVQRRTAARTRLEELEFGAPGGAQEAARLTGVFIGEQGARAGFTGGALELQREIAGKQVFDEPLTGEQSKQLLALNRITDERLIPALLRVRGLLSSRDNDLTTVHVSARVREHLYALQAAQAAANGFVFIGTPASKLIAFELKVTEVIQFLRTVQAGLPNAFESGGGEILSPDISGPGLEPFLTPEALGGQSGGNGGVGPQAGVSIGTVYMNQPATRSLTDLTRANEASVNV